MQIGILEGKKFIKNIRNHPKRLNSIINRHPTSFINYPSTYPTIKAKR